jgi:hypothetical protein
MTWLKKEAPARAAALRAKAFEEGPARGDALRALAEAIDVFETSAGAEAIDDTVMARMSQRLEDVEPHSALKAGPLPPTANGRLTPEAIQLIVRASFGSFRSCYEQGLQRDRDLSGLARTKFIIERDGNVRMVADDHSTLADPEVVRCIDAAFGALQFAPPRGGLVTVVYPIQFNPGP